MKYFIAISVFFISGLALANGQDAECYSYDPEYCADACMIEVLEDVGCVGTVSNSTVCTECDVSFNELVTLCHDRGSSTGGGGCG